MSVSTELALVYGGAFQIGPNGDLVLSQDAPGNPQATFERVLRIVLTNPTIRDADGNAIGRPDNLFHGDFGSGVRASIGEPPTPALVSGIQNRIIAALKSDPYIASTPAPSVTWTQLGVDSFQLIIACTSVLGEPFTLPSITLTPSGVVVPGGAQNG